MSSPTGEPAVPQEPCRYCGAASEWVFTRPLGARAAVRYFECADCGSLQTEQPTWRDADHDARAALADAEAVERALRMSLVVPVLLRAIGIDGVVPCVDVDEGTGLLARLLRDRGFQQSVATRAASPVHAAAHRVPLGGPGTYPVVTAIDALGRMVSPRDELPAIFAFDPDVVILAEPAYERQPATWDALAPHDGRRVFFYSFEALRRIAHANGMRLVSDGELHVLLRTRPRHVALDGDAPSRVQSYLARGQLLLQDGVSLLGAHQREGVFSHARRDRQTAISEPTGERRYPVIRAGTSAPRVVIDGVFFQQYKTGIARVWTEILEQWSRTDFAQRVLLLDRGGSAPEIPGIATRLIGLHDYADIARTRRSVQRHCDEAGAELFVSTYYTSPETTRSLLLVHDMIPEVAGMDVSHPMWREKAVAIQHASAFVCVSDATRADLVRLFPAAEGRTVVARPGVASRFRKLPEPVWRHTLAKLGIDKEYYLFVGAALSYKNGLGVAHALGTLPDVRKLALVCTGHPDEARQLRKGQIPPTVDIKFARVDDEALVALYNGAIALVFPSHFEGFGLPQLEAMACGCPVIVSDRPVMREVSGDAALFVDPNDVRSIAGAMASVRKPDVRARLVAAGLGRAKQFDWARTAAELRAAIEGAIVSR